MRLIYLWMLNSVCEHFVKYVMEDLLMQIHPWLVALLVKASAEAIWVVIGRFL
jgi:hypothetical protein